MVFAQAYIRRTAMHGKLRFALALWTCGILVSGKTPAAESPAERWLEQAEARWRAEAPLFEKRLVQAAARPEIQARIQEARDRLLAAYVAWLDQAQMSRAHGDKQEAAERRSDYEAMAAQLSGRWTDEASFVRLPRSTRWIDLAGGAVVSAEYAMADALDRTALQKRLQLERRTWDLFVVPQRPAGEGAAPAVSRGRLPKTGRCNYDEKKRFFSMGLEAKKEIALFFCLWSAAEQNASLQIRWGGETKTLQEIRLNNRALILRTGPRGSDAVLALRPGVNLVTVYLENAGSPMFEAGIHVFGRGLQVAISPAEERDLESATAAKPTPQR
jgi:hypothetical protein